MQGKRLDRTRLVLIVAILYVAAYAACLEPTYADTSPSQDAAMTMNFHMYSKVYVSSNSSILVYNGADTGPPTYSTPATGQVFCRVRQGAQIWFADVDAWLGGVSWITQPLAEDMQIQGDVHMTVWMASPDQQPFASGYAFGLSEVDPMGNLIGEPMYQYYYSTGNVLSSSAQPVTLSFTVDRTFTKGNIIGFLVIVGSTTEGWQFQVFFDSTDMNSFASLPVLAAPIPEYPQIGIVGTMAIAVFCTYFIVRRRQ